MVEGVEKGSIMATVSDAGALGSRISVDQAIRMLEKKPFIEVAAREFELIDASTAKTFDRTTIMAPDGYKPVFEIR
jgi:protein TorT